MTTPDDRRHDRGGSPEPRRRGRPAWYEAHPDVMPPEALERLEALTDPLIDLVGHAEREDGGSAAYDDPRFVTWMAEEGGGLSAVLSGEELQSLASRLAAELATVRHGVRERRGAPALEPVAVPGPVSTVLEAESPRHRAPLLELAVAAGAGRALWDADVEQSVALPDEVPLGRYLALRVTGESMMPLIHAGDVILVRLGGDASPGSIVVARTADEGYVVKRVGRAGGGAGAVELLSLNPDFPPVSIAPAANAVLGTVVLRWCAHEEGAARR